MQPRFPMRKWLVYILSELYCSSLKCSEIWLLHYPISHLGTKCYNKIIQEIKSCKVLEFKYNNGFLCPHKTKKEYNNS